MNEEEYKKAMESLGINADQIQGIMFGVVTKDELGQEFANIAGSNISIDQSLMIVSALFAGILLQAVETNEEICLHSIERFFLCLDNGVVLALRNLSDCGEEDKLKMLADAYRTWTNVHYGKEEDNGQEEQDSSED